MLSQDKTVFMKPPPLNVQAHALFLDLDGTIVEFAPHPEQVVASEEVRLLLGELSQAMNGAVALITGRTISSADAVLDGALAHVAGIHGFERRSGGEITQRGGDISPIVTALNEARDLAARGALSADIEDKGAAMALHYRRAPQFADAVRRTAAELARRHRLDVLEGSMVVELKLGGHTKADAIADFMAAPPFAGRTPVAVGDDITDEDAFNAVLRMGGVAVRVGERGETAARYRLADTAAVLRWLEVGVRP